MEDTPCQAVDYSKDFWCPDSNGSNTRCAVRDDYSGIKRYPWGTPNTWTFTFQKDRCVNRDTHVACNLYRWAEFKETPCDLVSGGGYECLFETCEESGGFRPQKNNSKGISPNNLNDENCCYTSPVVIDIDGDGFALTDAEGGVDFDFNGDGGRHRLSWTAADSDDAWLTLDRNGNGLIDSSLEMFGNFTEQPSSKDRNGFLALSEYDKAENGGNSDGRINNADPIFNGLRLWQDTNHNGVSEESELRTLSSSDVAALELDYRESKRTDEYGNRFRYRAKVESAKRTKIARWAWDVFLTLQQP